MRVLSLTIGISLFFLVDIWGQSIIRSSGGKIITTTGGKIITTTKIPAIGSDFQGGKLAYILQPEDPGYVAGEIHGLVAAPSIQIVWATWGCSGILCGTGTAIGTGAQNTANIIAKCDLLNNAARICDSYTNEGYNDWYLPSKDELNKLYINSSAIGGFEDRYFWSSSELDATYAHSQYFLNGVQQYSAKGQGYIRAVRSF